MQPWEEAGVTPEDDCTSIVCIRVFRDGERDSGASPIGYVAIIDFTFETPKYKFPGGRREQGESPRDAAQRETFEETGIRADASRFAFQDALRKERPAGHWNCLFALDIEEREMAGMRAPPVTDDEDIDVKYFERESFRRLLMRNSFLDDHLRRMPVPELA